MSLHWRVEPRISICRAKATTPGHLDVSYQKTLTDGGSITVRLVSCLTRWDLTKDVCSEAVESKLVKLETNCSAIRPLTLSVLWSYLSDCHWVAKNGALTWVINWRDFSLRPLVFCLCEADKQETLLKYFRHFKLEASKRVSIHFSLRERPTSWRPKKVLSLSLCVKWNPFRGYVMQISRRGLLNVSVTRFGEISPPWQN